MARTNPVLSQAFPQQARFRTEQDQYGYGTTPPENAQPQRLTIDDVVMHTGGLLLLLIAVATVTWQVVPPDSGSIRLVIPAALIAVGILIYTHFKKVVSPAAAIGYAVVEGFVVGAISRIYNDFYSDGIVLQAVVATIAVFFGMLALYQTGIIRATPKFRKVVMTATMGIFLTYMVSLGMSLFSDLEMPLLNSSSGLGILVSVAIVVVASLNFILDFDQIENAINGGAPREFAWAAALGLLVTLVWLYLEMLRLLAKLQRR